MTTSTQYIWSSAHYEPSEVIFNDLTALIYNQLLELYIRDLEVELMSEKLKNVMPLGAPAPYPWDRNRVYPPLDPWNTPYYGPPYKVTCLAGDPVKYSEEYDAHYNEIKNVWLDDKCSDSTCEFCTTRPETPL
jgi:hypothetical protein